MWVLPGPSWGPYKSFAIRSSRNETGSGTVFERSNYTSIDDHETSHLLPPTRKLLPKNVFVLVTGSIKTVL